MPESSRSFFLNILGQLMPYCWQQSNKVKNTFTCGYRRELKVQEHCFVLISTKKNSTCSKMFSVSFNVPHLSPGRCEMSQKTPH